MAKISFCHLLPLLYVAVLFQESLGKHDHLKIDCLEFLLVCSDDDELTFQFD